MNVRLMGMVGTNRDTHRSLIQRLRANENISNAFGLGYTFFDFTDTEHGDKLSHLDVYTLDSYDDGCLPMLRPVLQRAKENILVAIVLDWDHVDAWADQLWAWMAFLKKAVDFGCVEELRRRIQQYGSEGYRDDVELPLEEGQYECPLGVDFVACAIGSERVADSAGEDALSDETVDFAQQFLRSVAWRCGGSMLCVPYSLDIPFDGFRDIVSERLRLPMHSDAVAHAEPRVVEPDRVVVPSGWDTHGKIAALREESMEAVDELTAQWTPDNDDVATRASELYRSHVDGAVPVGDEAPPAARAVPRTDFQEFLAKQHEIQEKKLAEEPKESMASSQTTGMGDYNVGGIQVENMDEVLRRLKARDVANSSSNNAPSTPDRRSDRSESTTPNTQNEVLANFFQNLLERRRNSPGANNSPG